MRASPPSLRQSDGTVFGHSVGIGARQGLLILDFVRTCTAPGSAAHAANLFDINTEHGDVVGIDVVVEALERSALTDGE